MVLSIEIIKEVLHKKGYGYFEEELNIIGVRSSNDIANSFDDWIYLIQEGGEEVKIYPVTTDPGKYWLENPMNVEGTAILVPGQYEGAYTIGLHRGKYEALRQSRPVKVWRDNTKDTKLDKEGKIYEGMFGINIHRSNATSQSRVVEKWSAGCQVFQKAADFNEFMKICKASGQKAFSYTLLEKSDFQ